MNDRFTHCFACIQRIFTVGGPLVSRQSREVAHRPRRLDAEHSGEFVLGRNQSIGERVNYLGRLG